MTFISFCQTLIEISSKNNQKQCEKIQNDLKSGYRRSISINDRPEIKKGMF